MYLELQNGIVSYLETEEDMFGLPIFSDSPPNTEKAIDEAFKREGTVLIVGKPRQTVRSATEVNVQVPLMILHNEEVSTEGDDGLDRTPDQIIVDLISSLDRYQPQAFWTPIQARPFDSRDPEFGNVAWGMMVETKTLIVRDFAILIDHDGKGIATTDYAEVILTTNRGRNYGS